MARGFCKNIISFLLLLLMLQNSGGELLFHDLVHESADSHTTISKHFDGDGHQHVTLQCSCLRDFLLPAEKTPAIDLPAVTVTYFARTMEARKNLIISSPSWHTSFRGPPTATTLA